VPHRILVVDDETDELVGWETALRKAGYLVSTASTPARALELCDESVFDLVILDYLMPKMKGLEVLARIRKKIPLVRSIIVSGKLDKDLVENEVKDTIRGEVETDRYLHKPVKNDELLAAVAEALEKTQSSRPWDAIAADHIEGTKGTVSKAREAQDKLKRHIDKG
jgi:DNA-binding NtrC family response regulator